jgi:hypothetical protein
MSVEVQAVHQVTDELVDAAGRLLSQLSKRSDGVSGMAFASPRRLRSARRRPTAELRRRP